MKILLWIMLSGLSLNTGASAQPALDQPVYLGANDYCYQDAQVASVIYCMPRKLCRMDQPKYEYLDGTWRASFQMGICAAETERLKTAMKEKKIIGKEIRISRGIENSFQYSDFIQISKRYDPRLSALGDSLNLAGPTPYVLQINSVRGLFRRGRDHAPDILDSIFLDDDLDYVGTMQYSFVAKLGKDAFQAKSAIPLYVGIESNSKEVDVLLNRNFYIDDADDHLLSTYDLNSKTQCWDSPQPSRICVHD